MTVHLAERRRSARLPAAHLAVIADQHGRFIAKGRTANISEQGALILANAGSLQLEQIVIVELTVPSADGTSKRRVVVYTCRIARRQAVGPLLGVGVEFLRKLRWRPPVAQSASISPNAKASSTPCRLRRPGP